MARSVNHYLRDGTLHSGDIHKHDNGVVMSGAKMNKNSKKLFHFGDLSNKSQKKARTQWNK
tara:strand:- start:1010 stop:1192 length:183 start_codon:yes stop_codon:yes gene_type:complete